MTEDTRAGVAAEPLSSSQALDAAFAGLPCDLIRADGTVKRLAAKRWSGHASPVDLALFVEPCEGPTLDVGCGPGRLTAAVTDQGVDALGVDISAEAVRQTRDRGGTAVCQDVFDELPGEPRWQHVLLADGNIGLGGDPVRLLRRVAELLEPGGTALVELAGPGVDLAREQIRMRVAGRLSEPFVWATVGVDMIDDLAQAAALVVTEVRSLAGRHVATLQHVTDVGPNAAT